jgi:hypothetical protein
VPRFFIRHERQAKEDRTFKVYMPWWVDSFWYIQGSSIEKMVMAELVRRGIYFEHTPQSNTLGGFVDPSWEADFAFPQFKIWMEIQGSYFHSLPGAIEGDVLRQVKIEAAGWKFLSWWEFDIRNRLTWLFEQVPEFKQFSPAAQVRYIKKNGNMGLPFFEGGDGIDHLAGLRKALMGRRKPPQLILRRRRMYQRAPK